MIDKITLKIYERLIDEIKKEDNQEKLKKDILDPVIIYIGKKIWPYIICTGILFVLTLFILIYISYLLYYKQ